MLNAPRYVWFGVPIEFRQISMCQTEHMQILMFYSLGSGLTTLTVRPRLVGATILTFHELWFPISVAFQYFHIGFKGLLIFR